MSEYSSKSVFMQLPVLECVHACEFLTPVELTRLGQCNRMLRSLIAAADSMLWKNHCFNLWTGKQTLAQLVDQNLICQTPTLEPKYEMSRTPCESSDDEGASDEAQSSNLSPPLPASRRPHLNVEELRWIPPVPVEVRGRDVRWWEMTPQQQLSQLQLEMNKSRGEAQAIARTTWRDCYYSTLADSRRVRLTMADLVEGSWTITFHKMPLDEPSRVREIKFTAPNMAVVVSDVPVSMKFQVLQQGARIQIEGTPELQVSRIAVNGSADTTNAWGWQACNYFCTVASVDIPVPLYLRHLMEESGLRPR